MGEMMQLSYAQNLEDVHLDRVFAGLATGTYVDVGGGHPVADNVSFYFYLKGWRGLVVEPQADLADGYARVRPRDHVVSCLAGRADGRADFHVVEGLHGLSSALEAHAASARQYGAGYRTETRAVRPLSRLIDEAGLGVIDFLKIDVEGAEPDVLAGLDLARHRPRVILVEAINPHNPAASVDAWEPLLIAANYRLAFFDNLNRFYVAAEHAELAARFPAVPLAWDRVGHLWDHGRVAERTEHPDRVLADTLAAGLYAELLGLDPALLARIVRRGLEARKAWPLTPAAARALAGTAEWPRVPSAGFHDAASAPPLDAVLASDEVRAALGRIACMYDGGHLME